MGVFLVSFRIMKNSLFCWCSSDCMACTIPLGKPRNYGLGVWWKPTGKYLGFGPVLLLNIFFLGNLKLEKCRVVQGTFLVLYPLYLCVSLISQKVSVSSPVGYIGQTHRMSSLVFLSTSLSHFSQFLIPLA